MAENDRRPDEKIEFSDVGEALAYISLDQAVLQARRLVRQDEARYLERLKWDEIVWAETSSEQREDSYRVVLRFRRPARGLREEQTGEEEFLFDLTGVLQDRQVLLWPEGLIAEEGALDTAAMPEPEVSTLRPVDPPSIAEALTSPPDTPYAETTVHRSEVLPTSEEEGAANTRAAITVPDTAEVDLYTSTTEPTLLQCTQCETEYSPGQQFCTVCGAGIADTTVSPPSTMPAATPYIRTDDRPLGANSPRTGSVRPWIRRIAGIVFGLWGAFLMIGGGVSVSESLPGALLIMAGSVATFFGAGLLWPWNKLYLARLGSRWVIVGLVSGGFVAFVVGGILLPE
jgi:hypothetical protein